MVQVAAGALFALLWLGASAADAAILKRVHSGGNTMAPGSSGTAITLELADASKAFVVCSNQAATSGSSHQRASCVLSTNTLTITQNTTGGGSNIVVNWYVAEFESGVTVQRATASFASGTSAVTAPALNPAVDCSKSFVLISDHNGAASATNNDEEVTFSAVLGTFASPCVVTALTTTTALNIMRNQKSTLLAASVAWQVVTMEGATVLARGVSQIANGNTTTSASIPSSDSTKAFILMNRAAGSAVAGVEGEYQVRADFTGSSPHTGMTFTRVGTNASARHWVDVAYEVVRLDDGGTVQRGSNTVTGTTSTMGASGNIAAVDRSATVPFFSASGGDTTASGLDETQWTAAFPVATTSSATTQLQFTRITSSAVAATAPWFATTFYKCANSRLCSVGATGGNGTTTVSWSPIYDPQCVSGSTPKACEAVVLRDTAAITVGYANLTNGTAYAVGSNPGGGTSALQVRFNGTAQTFSESTANGLANGTKYFYRVYPKANAANTYITDAGMSQAISQVDVTPSANANLIWSYNTTGGSTLNAPMPGNGKVYVASNGKKMVTLNSSTGVEVATPVRTNGAIQSYLGWFPVSGGSNEAVVVGDQTGWLTSINAVTGARNWAIQLPVDNIGVANPGYIQAAVAAQLRAYTIAPNVCDSNAFANQYTTTTQDLIYVASRNNSRTANQVWAVRADTGAIQWTFPNPVSAFAMDRATGQPFVDYCSDRVWVSTGNNASQDSLWVINTVTATGTATKNVSFSGVGDQTSSAPALSYDTKSIWVGAGAIVYAFNAAPSPATVKSYSGLTLTNATITGFIWEDWSTPGRLYVPVVMTGGSPGAGVWCVTDTGTALQNTCSGWATNPRVPLASGTLAQPLVTGTAIFFPASDGITTPKIYQINTSDGALKDGTGRPFTVESGTAFLGGLSTEDLTQLYVGTSTQRTYRINLTGGNLP